MNNQVPVYPPPTSTLYNQVPPYPVYTQPMTTTLYNQVPTYTSQNTYIQTPIIQPNQYINILPYQPNPYVPQHVTYYQQPTYYPVTSTIIQQQPITTTVLQPPIINYTMPPVYDSVVTTIYKYE
jgi:hypothetical protein